MKLRATLVWEYDPPREKDYGTFDPAKMAEVDREVGPALLVESTLGFFGNPDANVTTFTVEPVEPS